MTVSLIARYGSSITFHTQVNGSVFAPHSDLLGESGGGIYGTVVAQDVTLTGQVHYAPPPSIPVPAPEVGAMGAVGLLTLGGVMLTRRRRAIA